MPEIKKIFINIEVKAKVSQLKNRNRKYCMVFLG